jgi:hypothetical protein
MANPDDAEDQDTERRFWAMKAHEETLEGMMSPLALANQIAQTIANAKAAGMRGLVVPELAKDWAENVMQDFLFAAAEVARDDGVSSRIVDRDLFDPNHLESVDWYEGIRIKDVIPYEDAQNEPEFWEALDHGEDSHYGELGWEPSQQDRWLSALGRTSSPERLLSSQYNRFFPVKIVMRVAANLLLNREGFEVDTDEGPEIAHHPLFLEDLRTECAKVASYAKQRMEWIDANKGTEFGSWFSVALTDGSTKQNERFSVQFVGSVRTKGKGLPFELGFLAVDQDGVVSITQTGIEFVLEENPLIDHDDGWKQGVTLSTQEQALIVKAIKRNLAAEWSLMQSVLALVADGKNTPSDIESFLVAEGRSKTEASVARTGVMARLQELGAVTRTKTGRKVTYSLAHEQDGS